MGVTFKDKCKEVDINYKSALKYRNRHKELTDEQVIEHIKNKGASFRQKCKAYGINYKNALYYRKRRGFNITDEEVLKHYTYDVKTLEDFKEKCLLEGIGFNKALRYKRNHTDISYDAVIKHYKSRNTDDISITFKDKCDRYGIEYRTAVEYRRHHSELTEEQIIEYYLKKKE